MSTSSSFSGNINLPAVNIVRRRTNAV